MPNWLVRARCWEGPCQRTIGSSGRACKQRAHRRPLVIVLLWYHKLSERRLPLTADEHQPSPPRPTRFRRSPAAMKCTVGRLSLMVPASQGGSQRVGWEPCLLAASRLPSRSARLPWPSAPPPCDPRLFAHRCPLQAPQRRAGLAGRRQPATVVTAFFSRGPNKPDNEPPAAASADTRETLVSDGAIKSLSPEARRIFREVRGPVAAEGMDGGGHAGTACRLASACIAGRPAAARCRLRMRHCRLPPLKQQQR